MRRRISLGFRNRIFGSIVVQDEEEAVHQEQSWFPQVSDLVTIISLAVSISYFCGWLELRTYFDTLNAHWVYELVDVTTFLKQGGTTLFMLFALFISGIFFVSQPRFLRKIASFLGWSLYAFLIFVIPATLLSVSPFPGAVNRILAKIVELGLTISWYLLTVAVVMIFLLRNRIPVPHLNERQLYSSCVFFILGFWTVSTIRGQAVALRDMDKVRSRLPVIVTEGSKDTMRLLLADKERLFAIDLGLSDTNPPIRIIPWTDVKVIQTKAESWFR